MPSTDANKGHIAPIAQSEFGPLNATVLLSGTVVGTIATVASDAFGDSLPAAVPLACAAGWVLALLLSLTLLGRNPTPTDGSLAGKYLACFRQGFTSARHHWRYALVLAIMAGMAAYAVYARVRRDDGGVLRAVLSMQREVHREAETTRASVDALGGKVDATRDASERMQREAHRDAETTRASVDALGGKVDASRDASEKTLSAAQRAASDVAALRQRAENTTPKERLAALGYKVGAEGAVDALSRGDAEALGLMRAAGVKPIPTSFMSMSGLEQLVLNAAADVGVALKAADLHGVELDKAFRPMSLSTGDLAIPDVDQLLATHGVEQGGFGDMKTPGETFVLAVPGRGPLLSSVAVTPLLVAVWKGRVDAAKALVTQGASPQAKGVLGLTAYRAELRKPDEPMGPGNGLRPRSRQVEIEVTPMGEAKRLGRKDLERVLAAGSK